MRLPYLRHGTIIGACPYWDNILDETNTNFFSDLESLSEVHQLFRKIQIMDRVFLLQDRAGCCANLVIGDSRALLFDTCCGWDDLMGAVRELTALPLLVINSLKAEGNHLSHMCLDETLSIVNRIKPGRTYLIHMSDRMGLHADSPRILPQGVELAYDRLIVKV